jgi:predicted dehydrogenase
MTSIHRRRFLTSSAGVGVGLIAGPSLATRASSTSAADMVVLAAIGCGGRGSALIQGFSERSDVAFAYVCDLDPSRGATTADAVAKRQSLPPRRVTDFRRVLDDKAVDAVVVATPDHWHGPATVFACQAGKDVYVEKPASHNIFEGRKMVEAARKYGRVVQVGTQSRSARYVRTAIDYLQSGKLGGIHLVKVYNLKSGGAYHKGSDGPPPAGFDHDVWLGAAPHRPYNSQTFHGGWHAYWDFSGGDMADDGVHQLDIARWLIGKDFPKSVMANGNKLAFNDDRETPDTQEVVYDFGTLHMTFELTQWASYMDKIAGDVRQGEKTHLFPYWPQCATRIEVYGTEGLMYLGRHGGGWQVFGHSKTQSRPGELVAQDYGMVPEVPHKENFIHCIRTRERPNADIEEGHRSAALVHLGNIATRLDDRKLHFDAATESFPGDEQANRLLKRQNRTPFSIPGVV